MENEEKAKKIKDFPVVVAAIKKWRNENNHHTHVLFITISFLGLHYSELLRK